MVGDMFLNRGDPWHSSANTRRPRHLFLWRCQDVGRPSHEFHISWSSTGTTSSLQRKATKQFFIKVLQLVSKRFITSLHELLTILESIEAEHISRQIFDAVAWQIRSIRRNWITYRPKQKLAVHLGIAVHGTQSSLVRVWNTWRPKWRLQL